MVPINTILKVIMKQLICKNVFYDNDDKVLL